MTGRFTLSGDYGVLEGFEFTGEGGVYIQGGDFNRVTRNYIHVSPVKAFTSTMPRITASTTMRLRIKKYPVSEPSRSR